MPKGKDDFTSESGLTKLQYAAIRIAAGMSNGGFTADFVAKHSVDVASRIMALTHPNIGIDKRPISTRLVT
jgi:hypothetical protein